MQFYHRLAFPQWMPPRECICYTPPFHCDRYRLHFFHMLEDYLSSFITK